MCISVSNVVLLDLIWITRNCTLIHKLRSWLHWPNKARICIPIDTAPLKSPKQTATKLVNGYWFLSKNCHSFKGVWRVFHPIILNVGIGLRRYNYAWLITSAKIVGRPTRAYGFVVVSSQSWWCDRRWIQAKVLFNTMSLDTSAANVRSENALASI